MVNLSTEEATLSFDGSWQVFLYCFLAVSEMQPHCLCDYNFSMSLILLYSLHFILRVDIGYLWEGTQQSFCLFGHDIFLALQLITCSFGFSHLTILLLKEHISNFCIWLGLLHNMAHSLQLVREGSIKNTIDKLRVIPIKFIQEELFVLSCTYK